jgi:hypothetical protein
MSSTTCHRPVPAPLRPYVDEVALRVRDALDGSLMGVWLVGSAALGDYDPRRSDIDVQAVVTHRLPRSERRTLAGRLEHGVLPCPARGLEFVLYAIEDLAAAGGPCFQLNLNTGARMEHHVACDADEDPAFWFTIDASIARQSGVALTGPPAAVVFPELPRPLVAAAVLDALDFFAGASGSRDEALLSACRAWAWAVDGVWRSKGESALWARPRVADAGPVERVLRRRVGEPAEPPGDSAVERLLASARAALTAHVSPRCGHGSA